MSRFIDEHRGRFGVEPICRTLGVSASAYYHRKTSARSRRAVEDERLLGEIERVQAANYSDSESLHSLYVGLPDGALNVPLGLRDDRPERA